MQFTNAEIEQILFGHFLNKTHLNERRKVYVKRIVKNFRHFIPQPIPKSSTDRTAAILLFSNELFFDLRMLKQLNIHSYKDKLSIGTRLNFDHEEVLLVTSTFLPMLRHRIFKYVCNRVEKKIAHLKPLAFVCNFPQLIDHVIAMHCNLHGIPVITIQHGIYMPDFYKPLPFEKERATFIFVWGQLYSECYQRGGIPPENLKICSPPINLPESTIQFPSKFTKPVFLGQALYKINAEVYERYNRMLSDLIAFWDKQNIIVSYKPHPRELLHKSLTQENLARLHILNSKYVHDEFFKPFDVAYSINSTSLVHALRSGLLVFQLDLKIPDLPTEDFSKWSSIVNLDGIDSLHQKALAMPPAYRLDHYFLNLTENSQQYNSRLLLKTLGYE